MGGDLQIKTIHKGDSTERSGAGEQGGAERDGGTLCSHPGPGSRNRAETRDLVTVGHWRADVAGGEPFIHHGFKI